MILRISNMTFATAKNITVNKAATNNVAQHDQAVCGEMSK